MDWQGIIDYARTISWGLSTSQLPDATAVLYMNQWYHAVKRAIIDLKEDYFWDIIELDATVADQNEYAIPTWLSGNFDKLDKTLRVSVKYGATWDYYPCEKVYPYQLDKDLDWYATNQSTTKPFFFIADNSYFIYPTPTEAVTDWLKVYGIKNLIDIDENTTEANIFGGKIHKEYFYIIALYMRYMYYMSRGVDFKADKIEAKRDYEETLEKEILEWLQQRDMSIINKRQP